MNNCPDYYGKRPQPYFPPRRPYKNNLNFTKEELEEKKQKAIAEEAEKTRRRAAEAEMKKVNESLQIEPSDMHINSLNSVTQIWEEQKKMLIEERARKPEIDLKQNSGVLPTRVLPSRAYTKHQLSPESQEELEKRKRKVVQIKAEMKKMMKESLQATSDIYVNILNTVTQKQQWEEDKTEEKAKRIELINKGIIPAWRPGRPANIKKKFYWDFTKEELEEKKQKAIAEEAEKKARKAEMERFKNESRWIEIGRALCDITPDDFLLDEAAENGDEEATGEEIVASVHTFVENFKKLMGDQSKGTVFGNCFAMTGALCKVNQKSVVYIDQRIEKLKKVREEAARKEALQRERYEERWIEIGRALCSLTPADVGIEESEGQKAPESVHPDAILSTLDSLEKAPEEVAFAPEEVAWRGEDVVANVYHFSSALRDLMGIHARHTCLRSQFEFTSVFSNVAEKSVRDRHPVRRVGRSKYFPDNF